jgi:hypothetical protein
MRHKKERRQLEEYLQELESLFPSENLQKMSQPTIRLPKIKQIGTRPDQQVAEIETPRHKKIFSGTKAHAMAGPDASDEHVEYNQKASLRDMSPKKVKGITYYSTSPDIKQIRAFHFVGPKYAPKEHNSPHEQYVKQHEGAHYLFKEVQHKLGPEARSNLLKELTKEMNPDDQWRVFNFLTNVKRYKSKSPSINEEILNWSRDILVNPDVRRQFVEHHKNVPEKELISSLKSSWKKVHKRAKNITIDDLVKSEKTTPSIKELKANKVNLTDEERSKAISNKCVWDDGPNGKETCAIWKAKISGKVYYCSNTHRAYSCERSLDEAIKKFHEYVKESS